ncbi:MAG: hypothetical protein K6F07_02750 [Bacilli bacterium]|nr:hypothetical protein [Bacilli bacterium]
MKKSKILFTLTSLLLAGTLVACGTKKSSDEPAKPDTPVEPDEPVTPTSPWSAEQLALLKQYVYGVELPHPGIEVTMVYDDENEALFVSSKTSDVSVSVVTEYAKAFTSAGWVIDSDEGVYYAEKSVETEDGTRFVDAQFTILDEDGYAITSGSGTFSMYVYDPYYYEWPEETVAAIVEYFESDATVPAFDADYYGFDTSYIYFGQVALYCYVESTTAVADYKATLLENDWSVSEEVDEDGFYNAIAPSEDLQLSFAYDADYQDLDIYISSYTKPVTEWPAEDVAQLVENVAPGSATVVPALDGGDNYVILEDWNEVDVYGDESLLDTYIEILLDNDWELLVGENESENTYNAPAGDVKVVLTYSDYQGALWIEVKASTPILKAWPTETVASFVEELVPGSETVVPALDGGSKYETLNSYAYGVNVYGEESLLTTYQSILVEASWVDDGNNTYHSSAEDIQVELVYFEDGYLSITISKYYVPSLEWPAADIANLLGEDVTDTIPAYSGDNEGFILKNDNGYYTVEVLLAEDADIEQAIGSYITTLTDAQWTDKEGIYYSPNDQIRVAVYDFGNGRIVINFERNPLTKEFPLDRVNAFLDEHEFGFSLTAGHSDTAEEGYYFYEGETINGNPYCFVSVTGNYLSEIEAFYQSVLSEAGYTLNEDWSTEDYHVYQDALGIHEIDFSYSEDSNETAVFFYDFSNTIE